MGNPRYRTIAKIRQDFNISEDVKIIRVDELTEVAPKGFTCITIGQLEAGLRIPLYYPDRPLQYEVLSLLSRAPGQMNGNFYRIINEFEDYNKANPETKFSAEEILKLHSEARCKLHAHCFNIRLRPSSVLPFKVLYDSNDHQNWPKFPILISGNWIHHSDFPPPPEIYFNPIIWRLDKVVSKNSVNSAEKPLVEKTQHSNTVTSPSWHLLKHDTVTVLTPKNEETSPDEYPPALKRQRKVSEDSRQVPGSSVGAEVACNRDDIQRIHTAFTIANRGNPEDEGIGLKFEELDKDEFEFRRTGTGGGEDFVYIGNFPVREQFAALYEQIWQRHGHLATRNVVKKSTFMLFVAVSELLEAITMMSTVKRSDLDYSLLAKWDGQIAEAEALQFNVGWLRRHFDEVKNTLDDASSLSNSKETHEQALDSALQRQSAARAKVDSLKSQLEKAEQELAQVTLEVIQHEHAVSEDLVAWLQKTFLHNAI